MNIEYEIIDFHTHPFMSDATNICSHKEYLHTDARGTEKLLRGIGITKICGSVLGKRHAPDDKITWEELKAANDEALALRELYGDFYVPGFHIHPDFQRESMEEIERMAKLGVRLVGELVPYWHCWRGYGRRDFYELLDVCAQYNMVVSFHPMDEDQMDKMVADFPRVTFVGAHPGEYETFMWHLERIKNNDNYYMDLSGTGIFRHGMLRHGIDAVGAEKIIFGSDYPTCNPSVFVGGVYLDEFITDSEKRMIFSENAKRILGI